MITIISVLNDVIIYKWNGTAAWVWSKDVKYLLCWHRKVTYFIYIE